MIYIPFTAEDSSYIETLHVTEMNYHCEIHSFSYVRDLCLYLTHCHNDDWWKPAFYKHVSMSYFSAFVFTPHQILNQEYCTLNRFSSSQMLTVTHLNSEAHFYWYCSTFLQTSQRLLIALRDIQFSSKLHKKWVKDCTFSEDLSFIVLLCI